MKKTIIYVHSDEDMINLLSYLHFVGVTWHGSAIIKDDDSSDNFFNADARYIDISCKKTGTVGFCIDQDDYITYMDDGTFKGENVYEYFGRDFMEYDHYEYDEYVEKFDIEPLINGIKMGLL